MQGYRRSRKEFSWSRCTVNNMEFSLIKVAVRYIQYIAYTPEYSFNRDDADCVGRLIHLALEVDIH